MYMKNVLHFMPIYKEAITENQSAKGHLSYSYQNGVGAQLSDWWNWEFTLLWKLSTGEDFGHLKPEHAGPATAEEHCGYRYMPLCVPLCVFWGLNSGPQACTEDHHTNPCLANFTFYLYSWLENILAMISSL